MHQNAPATPEKILTLKQRETALLLAQGKTIAQCAQEVKVHESTVDRWEKQAAFLEEIRQAENSIYNESLRMLQKHARVAVASGYSCVKKDANVTQALGLGAMVRYRTGALSHQIIAPVERLLYCALFPVVR